jgi:hypothetical protein
VNGVLAPPPPRPREETNLRPPADADDDTKALKLKIEKLLESDENDSWGAVNVDRLKTPIPAPPNFPPGLSGTRPPFGPLGNNLTLPPLTNIPIINNNTTVIDPTVGSAPPGSFERSDYMVKAPITYIYMNGKRIGTITRSDFK